MTIRLSLRQEQTERERKFQGHWMWLVEGPTIWVGSWSSGRSHENPPNLSDHARGLLLSLNRQCNLNYTKLYDSARFTTNAGVLSRAFSDPGFVEPLRRSFNPKRGLRSILTWRVVFSGPSTVIETQLSWLSARATRIDILHHEKDDISNLLTTDAWGFSGLGNGYLLKMVGKGLNRESCLYSCLIVSDCHFYSTFGYRFHSKNSRFVSRSVPEYHRRDLHQTSRHAWVVQWRSSAKETRFFLYRSVKSDSRDATVFLTSSISSLRISTSTAVFLLSKRLGPLLSGLYPSVSPTLSCHQTSKVHLLHSVGRSANYSLESDNDD